MGREQKYLGKCQKIVGRGQKYKGTCPKTVGRGQEYMGTRLKTMGVRQKTLKYPVIGFVMFNISITVEIHRYFPMQKLQYFTALLVKFK